MIIKESDADTKRCCGPAECGRATTHDEGQGPRRRYCIGTACMAWTSAGTVYEMPDGQLTESRDLAGNWPPVDLGMCGLAPER